MIRILILSVLLVGATAVAALRLQSPKAKEQAASLATVRNAPTPPPIPAIVYPLTVAPAAPPGVKTNRETIWWAKLPDDQMYHVFGVSNQARLYTNFAVIQGRPINSTNWIVIGKTNGTNVIFVVTNSTMLFRATAEWR